MAGELEKNLKKGLKDLMAKKNVTIKKKLLKKPIDVTNKKGMEKAIREISGMEMGGEVMDTTKSMSVGMMDGGKVKKMNMGGVVPGRGGKFKGVS
tara:strand:- start:409 stop:693 length:285 start_codon:yes stop_codon:yes gene_type:complete